MTEEFNLSDKETVYCLYKREDVKEFIRRLRVLILNKEHYDLEKEIDKLAGENLI